jgi:hypothetical protein
MNPCFATEFVVDGVRYNLNFCVTEGYPDIESERQFAYNIADIDVVLICFSIYESNSLTDDVCISLDTRSAPSLSINSYSTCRYKN